MVFFLLPIVVAVSIIHFSMRSDLSDKGYTIPFFFSFTAILIQYADMIRGEPNPVLKTKYRRTWCWYWSLLAVFGIVVICSMLMDGMPSAF